MTNNNYYYHAVVFSLRLVVTVLGVACACCALTVTFKFLKNHVSKAVGSGAAWAA